MKKALTLSKLLSKPQGTKKTDLARIKELAGPVPFKVVHIAGSNGKGSVAHHIAQNLNESKIDVGLFTSPHIRDLEERIQINGIPISAEELELLSADLDELTFFETLTVSAIRYFRKKKVKIAVIETGLGGRFDATNFLNPILSIITSISLEHTNFLGDHLDKIAYEKAGIIKNQTPVIIGPTANRAPILEAAEKMGAPLYKTDFFDVFEEENFQMALQALEFLKVPPLIRKEPPGRFQEIKKRVIIDGAHNPAAFEALFHRVLKVYPNKRIKVGLALSNGRSLEESLAVIRKYSNDIKAIPSSHERLQNLPLPTLDAYEVLEGEVLVLTGSFYMMLELTDRVKAS